VEPTNGDGLVAVIAPSMTATGGGAIRHPARTSLGRGAWS